jgi:hypothetical protein
MDNALLQDTTVWLVQAGNLAPFEAERTIPLEADTL